MYIVCELHGPVCQHWSAGHLRRGIASTLYHVWRHTKCHMLYIYVIYMSYAVHMYINVIYAVHVSSGLPSVPVSCVSCVTWNVWNVSRHLSLSMWCASYVLDLVPMANLCQIWLVLVSDSMPFVWYVSCWPNLPERALVDRRHILSIWYICQFCQLANLIALGV